MMSVIHNKDEHRYEIELDNGIGFLAYREADGVLDLYSTQVPPAHRGKGIAGTIVRKALDDARRTGKKIIPTCGFVAAFIKRHREYDDLVAK